MIMERMNILVHNVHSSNHSNGNNGKYVSWASFIEMLIHTNRNGLSSLQVFIFFL